MVRLGQVNKVLRGKIGAMNFKRMLWPVVVPVLGCVVLAGTAYSLNRLYLSWNRLSMNMTMSGSNVSPSTSMELYEINLRRMEVDLNGKSTGKILEWKLAIPRAYLIDENGQNNSIYDDTNASKASETHYGFTLAMQVSGDSKKSTPRTLIATKGKLPRDILVGASNNVASSIRFIVDNDLCVRQTDEDKIAEKYNLDRYSSSCLERDYRCAITTQIDGWAVGTTVTKELFDDPESACKIAKDFLRSYTVKRDDARPKTGNAP
jgi:hypothetical protein